MTPEPHGEPALLGPEPDPEPDVSEPDQELCSRQDQPVSCRVCRMFLNGTDQLRDHYRGRRHRMMVRLAATRPTFQAWVQASVLHHR